MVAAFAPCAPESIPVTGKRMAGGAHMGYRSGTDMGNTFGILRGQLER
jgi:hypothetical protein